MSSHGIVLSKYAKTLPSYDPLDTKDGNKEAFDHLIAYLYLHNSDMKKYGSVLKGLKEQQSLKNDQFPKTVTSAMHVLSQHQFDNSRELNNKKREENNRRNEAGSQDLVLLLTFTQLEGKCWCCGKSGHKSNVCRHKDRPKYFKYLISSQ